MAVAVTIAPTPIQQYFNNSGAPNVEGSILTQIGGVNAATYQDSAGTIALPNPIPLNSRGEISNASGLSCQLFLVTGQAYTFTMFDANGVQIDQATYVATPPALTQASLGAILFPQTAAETAAGLTAINEWFQPGQPERYVANFAYTTTAGIIGTDFSAAINLILTSIYPVTLGPYLYRCVNSIVMQPEQAIIAVGVNETGLCFPSTFSGVGINWNLSNAAKIQLYGFTMYMNNPAAATGGIVLGSNIHPAGTEGYIDQVMVRDLPASALAFDIYCNIAEFGNIYALNSAGIRLLGNGAVQQIENTNASGFLDVNGGSTATEIEDFYVGFLEVEAPQNNLFLLTVRGQLTIPAMVPSLPINGTFNELIYITSSATNWSIGIPQLYYGGSNGGSTQPTFTNLFFDQGANVFFGSGNTLRSTSLKGMCGYYQSGLTTQGGTFAVKKQQLNNFSLLIANNGGTIQHKITAAGQTGVAGNWITSVSGESITYASTPTIGSGVNFTNGGGISSANNYEFVFNTGAEVAADSILFATITQNGTGTAYMVRPTIVNLNINGVTQNWLAFQLTNPTTGANVSWATALGTATWFIEVTFLGFIK